MWTDFDIVTVSESILYGFYGPVKQVSMCPTKANESNLQF